MNDRACFLGIVLGLGIGAIYAQMRVTQRGALRRKDIRQFGAASAEQEAQSSIRAAQQRARARQDSEQADT